MACPRLAEASQGYSQEEKGRKARQEPGGAGDPAPGGTPQNAQAACARGRSPGRPRWDVTAHVGTWR